MNAKQTAQTAPVVVAIAAAAPQLFILGVVGCGIYFGLKWLLSDDKDKKPELPPSTPAASERPAIRPPNSGGNVVEKPFIPPVSALKSVPPPAPSAAATSMPAVPAAPVPTTPKNALPPLPAAPVAKLQSEIPQPVRKKIISRDDMAKIFTGGRGLTRNAAVSALKALGFGKTAAYQALEINGRFAPWLLFASDGIITWKF